MTLCYEVLTTSLPCTSTKTESLLFLSTRLYKTRPCPTSPPLTTPIDRAKNICSSAVSSSFSSDNVFLFISSHYDHKSQSTVASHNTVHPQSVRFTIFTIGRRRKDRARQRWSQSTSPPPSRRDKQKNRADRPLQTGKNRNNKNNAKNGKGRGRVGTMGQEVSTQIGDSVPPETLRERSLEAVAELITSGKARRIVVLTGAGISTAAGIPDFRSPGTGLYANLKRLKLPYAEAVFSIDYFRENPNPFYVLAKELYPGQYHPTVSHVFLALLARKGLLKMLFTQNIDCLERATGIPADLIVEAHGSFATQRCIECRMVFPDKEMREHVERASVPICPNPECVSLETRGKPGLVKPDIVFFGESLPDRFHELRHAAASDVDLVLVLGTSLSVFPFASLPKLAPESVPRVLFNREAVGDFGTRADDVLSLGICDAGIRKFAEALGWHQELDTLWREMVGNEEANRQQSQGAILAAQAIDHDDSSSDDEDDIRETAEVDEVDEVDEVFETEEANDQPPEIGGALSSAEAEVNEIAKEIEAVLKLSGEENDETSTENDTAKRVESTPTTEPPSEKKDKVKERPQL
ncbi:sir2 family protein [Ophiostoma piceae UAMH 11346]|uniref:Sir2 family protein n=1 Tax=Ophiostoma piceae (strain UAMH 11346) TaxID=1262450 RepID=S3CLX1_OPHP1|nr:sir2 family protein [Ophiostoma piceae UAMH 11346]